MCKLAYLFAKKEGKTREKSFSLNPEVKTVNPVIVEFLMLACFSYGTFLTSTAVNKCSPNPCKNMGACSEFEDDYVCNCPQGFKGKTCEGTFIYETHRRYIDPTKSKLIAIDEATILIFIEFDNVSIEMTTTKSAKKIMCGTFKSLVSFFNLLSLISVQDIVAVVARPRQYRFPTNNSLRATIWLKNRR